VVILGILAAIVIPQFTQASTEAKTNSLCSDLQTLRSQIELYKVQHNDIAPAAGTADPNFTDQMTQTSTIGGVCSGNKVRTSTYNLGPYLERVPENPFNNMSTIGAAGTVDSTTIGWAYDPNTGEVRAADTAAHAEL
jgi:general secretion pathway protein G